MVKTRLAQSLPVDAIAGLYRCLLEDTLALAQSLPNVEVAIMCPASDVEELERLAGDAIRVVPQAGEGLAAGLTSVFAHFTNSAHKRVIAFNSDSPHLPAVALQRAFEALANCDVVVGPTNDGGYYLVGAKTSHPALFNRDGMGTSNALDTLRERVRTLGLSLHLADPFYDIDLGSDLLQLEEELRQAPSRAPRTAAWLKEFRVLRPGSASTGNLPHPVTTSPQHGRRLHPTASHRLYILGIILLGALSVCSRNFVNLGTPSFLLALAVAAVAYLLAIREFFVTPSFPKHVVLVGLVFAALWQFSFLRIPPGSDDDIHRYVWDGRIQRLGYDPYTAIPNDPALSALHTPDTRTLNNSYLPSPYPPGAELFFRAVTAIHESVFAMKVAFVVCDWLLVLVLLDILRRTGQGVHWVLAYAWHPLLAIEVAGSGHIDILGVLLLAVSFAALGRHWRTIAALAFGLAVSIKFLPVVLLPLYWKRVRIRDGALAAVVFGLLYVPFLSHGRIPIGSLGTYIQSFRFNGPLFAAIERVLTPQLAAGFAVLAGLITAGWLRKTNGEVIVSTPTGTPAPTVQQAKRAGAFAWPMAASLLCAPVVYPWYLLWILPFIRFASTVPIVIWTVSILPTYYIWHLRTLGRPWILPSWILLLEYGSVAIAAAILAWRRITRT